jgi:hypothetical protein
MSNSRSRGAGASRCLGAYPAADVVHGRRVKRSEQRHNTDGLGRANAARPGFEHENNHAAASIATRSLARAQII